MRKFLLPILMILFAPIAWADEPKYGGQIKRIGPYEAELVVKGADVELYVIKDHKPLKPTTTMAASVRLFVGNAEQSVELAPAGDKLVGKATAASKGTVRAMTTLTEGGKEVGKAQYSLTAR